MLIHIIEDDAYKYSRVSEFLYKFYKDAALVHSDNVANAIEYLRLNSPDLIILDMSLPSHPAIAGEGSPVSMPTGGIEIILELKILNKLNLWIIILTQYPDVEVENEYYSISESEKIIENLYEMKKLSVVHYDNDSIDWRDDVTNILVNK